MQGRVQSKIGSRLGWASVALTGACVLLPAQGQMHKVTKPEDVVRAVGVYEWTGERAKPTASRLIPVTIFIDGALQDAGVYLARPVPLALDTGNVYEVDKAGKPEGTVDLVYSRHLRSPDESAGYDDGWFGYGDFHPPVAPKKSIALKPLPPKGKDAKDAESDRPTFTRRAGSGSTAPNQVPGSTGSTSAPNQSSTPGSTSGSTATTKPADPAQSGSTDANATPPEDPDRPHMTRRAGSATDTSAAGQSGADTTTKPDTSPASADKSSGGASSGNPADDPDRPTLRRRSPEEAKKARKEASESSASGLATSLNDDPNRPTLHHGKGQQALKEADLPKLQGLPVGLKQEVAVSDAKTRPEHDFARPWEDDAEKAATLAKMQTLAQAALASYAAGLTQPVVAKGGPNSKLRHAKSAQAAAPVTPLMDEQLAGYMLSYGGAPTYAYTAHTDGDGPQLRYVTIVAQRDAFGELNAAIQSVTDATHLDRTPWMRLVDVVDADASNRASLLFELRGQSARQFALYRVIATRSEQIFLTGSTQ